MARKIVNNRKERSVEQDVRINNVNKSELINNVNNSNNKNEINKRGWMFKPAIREHSRLLRLSIRIIFLISTIMFFYLVFSMPFAKAAPADPGHGAASILGGQNKNE